MRRLQLIWFALFFTWIISLIWFAVAKTSPHAEKSSEIPLHIFVWGIPVLVLFALCFNYVKSKKA